jgi:hypothetical protein
LRPDLLAHLNNDGWVDLFQVTYFRGWADGIGGPELIEARVVPNAGGMGQYRWIHSNHSYKSGGLLRAHFDLGTHANVNLRVRPLNGREAAFNDVGVDRYLPLDLSAGEVMAQ